jgi:hypothetical protein
LYHFIRTHLQVSNVSTSEKKFDLFYLTNITSCLAKMRLLEPEMDADNIQVYFANVLWVAFSIPSLVKYPTCVLSLGKTYFTFK